MLIIILLFSITLNGNYEVQQQIGKKGNDAVLVKGIVATPERAVLQNAKVIFKNDKGMFTTFTDINGEYEINLPMGTYEVTTQIDNWYDLHRACFAVNGNSTISMTLLPAPKVNTISLTLNEKGLTDKTDFLTEPRYFYFSPNKISNEMNVLVQYYDKKGNTSPTFFSANLTYDKTTISAKKIKVVNDTCIVAQESVFFEQNGEVWIGKKLKGCFAKEKFEVSEKKR